MSNGSRSQSSSFHFLAGLGSGLTSAVLLQPADLLKTRVQQSGQSSLRASVREILNGPNTLRSFWRGTLPSALRTGFGSAIYFTSLNALRQNVSHSNVLKSVSLTQEAWKSSSSSTLPKLSNLANLTTGAFARASVGFILMPMTIIKVRYESNLYSYRSIAEAGVDIFKNEGFKGFFSGFGATAIRDAPYAGLYVVFYEQLKRRLSSLTTKISGTGLPDVMKGSTSASINFGSGIVAAGLSTAITNPFDSIKTRIQLEPEKYRNTWHAGKKMIMEDGFRSLFDGLALRMGRKAVSSALAWTLYEELIRRARTPWNRP